MKQIKNTMMGALLLLMGQMTMAQDGVAFFKGAFAEAQTEAVETEKLIFMDAYTTWCGPCKWMAANSFPDAKVGDLFNSAFVNLKMDMEKGEGPRLSRIYRVQAYPTLMILDAEGKVLEKLEGALPPAELYNWARETVAKHAPELLGPAETVVQPKPVRSRAVDLKMGLSEKAMMRSIEAGDRAGFESEAGKVLSRPGLDWKFLYLDGWKSWVQANGGAADFVSAASGLLETEGETDAMLFNQAAWYTLELSESEDDLLKALGWAERSVTMAPKYANRDTYAHLLLAAGDRQAATEQAEQAIALAQASGDDFSGTSALLERIAAQN